MKIGAIGIRTKMIVGDAATWYLVKKYVDRKVGGGIEDVPEELKKYVRVLDSWVDVTEDLESISNKVDKVDGKGLSTEDYTTAEKSKVANMPLNTNAELGFKVDKVAGSSLVPDTEIDKLAEYPEFENLEFSHANLTDKNSEAAFQHVNTTVTKETLDEADKVALYDSVTGKVVLTHKSNLETDLTTVNQEITNLQNEVSLLDAVQSAKIKDIENVLSTANLNQSAQLSVSGVSPISLPKNAANGGMSVKLEGLTEDVGGVITHFEPTGRVRSVGKNGLNPTALYLTAPELRSNGLVKDEIRKGANGYELVKRVGVGTLGGEIINQANILEGFVTLNAGILGTTITTTGPGGGRRKAPFLDTSKWYKITLNYTADANWEIRAFATQPLIGLAPGLTAGTNVNLVAFIQSSDGGIYFRNAYSGRVITINSMSIKEVSTQDVIAIGSTFSEFGSNIHYDLATPTIAPISYGGILNSAENGTVYHEPIIADAGVYDTKMDILLTDYPIATIEEIIKHENGVDTYLDVSTAVIAGDGLSFTHPDLADGDLVLFTYAFDKESTNGNITASFYDSNVVKIDTITGKAYKITDVVTNGVLTRTLTEV